jgi:hypothetical protein
VSRYQLIGIDLDGTLLSSDGTISQINVNAIAKARQAGVLVIPCTGRALRESQFAMHAFDRLGVFVTGAVINDLKTGCSLDLAVIEPHLAMTLIEQLYDLPEAVFVLHERSLTGYDYMVTGRGELMRSTQAWFQMTDSVVRFVNHPSLEDLHHALRVGVVAPSKRVAEVEKQITSQLKSQVNLHSFEAIAGAGAKDGVHVLEIFAGDVDKWRGIQWVAQQNDIADDAIAFIGDQVNDLPPIRAAACGIAMGNAEDVVKDAADRHTSCCDENGVAHAIDQLLSGVWD